METHRRGSDGRRIFTAAFKQEQVGRVARQELTLAELARELVRDLFAGLHGTGQLRVYYCPEFLREAGSPALAPAASPAG